MADLPQTELEPILVNEAARRGVKVRFDTEIVDFKQEADGVIATMRDRLNGVEYNIRAGFLVGADGARSRIVDKLGIPLTGKSGLGDVFNVLIHADLTIICDFDMARSTALSNPIVSVGTGGRLPDGQAVEPVAGEPDCTA